MGMTLKEYRKNVPIHTKREVREKEIELESLKRVKKIVNHAGLMSKIKDGYLIAELDLPGENYIKNTDENKIEIEYKEKSEDKEERKINELTKKEFEKMMTENIPFYPMSTMKKLEEKIERLKGVDYNMSIIYDDINFLTTEVSADGFTINFFKSKDDYEFNFKEDYIYFKVNLNKLKEIVEKEGVDFPKLKSDNVKIYYNPFSKEPFFDSSIEATKELVKKAGLNPILVPNENIKNVEIDNNVFNKDNSLKVLNNFLKDNFKELGSDLIASQYKKLLKLFTD